MNEHNVLEQELNSLGRELREAPSIVPVVLRRIAAGRLLDTNSGMSGPEQQSWPVDRAPGTSSGVFPPSAMRRRVFISVGATAAALACIASALIPRTGGVAFADVREQLAKIRTASLTFTRLASVRNADGEAESQSSRQRLFVRSDGCVRTEGPGKNVSIFSPDDFVRLELDPERQTATVRYTYSIENKRDVVTTLRTLHGSAVARSIPSREVEGVSCPGFQIEENDSTLLVWIDPQTRLPKRAERSFTKAIAEMNGELRKLVETYEDMQFDEPLPDELFALTPPAGFAVTTIGVPPADRKEIFRSPLVATPNVGVGPLKFGMAREEVVRRLGKPDAEEIVTPRVPVSKRTSNIDGIERPAGAVLTVLTKLHTLQYNALGLRLTVEAEEGLRGIQCFGQETLGPQARTFTGATDKGIRIGSPREAVAKAYGEPEESSSTRGSIWKYEALHLEFSFSSEGTVRTISLSEADQHPLRFRWSAPGNENLPAE